MAGLNKVILIGRIGKDPDTFQFDDGTKKISFSLATTESYRDKTSNDWKDITEWHNIVGYRYLAEKNVAKGDLIYVEGKIKSRKYKDRDGNERYMTEIIAEKLNMLSRYQAGEGRSQNTYQTPQTQEIPTATPIAASNNEENNDADDLPF
jgi:single-strand DNA-binding protein